jgi:predicted nucleic acid-binding Zn ribbon protein
MPRVRGTRVCTFEDCGRPSRALGLCQTHYKHQRKFGKPRPINPKRQGREGTVRYSGLSLTTECAQAIDKLATRQGLAPNAIITDILESWAKRHGAKPAKPAKSAKPTRGRAR